MVEEVEELEEELPEVLPEELPEEEPLLFPHPATEAAMVQAASTQKIRFRLEFAFIMTHSFLIRLARVPLRILTEKSWGNSRAIEYGLSEATPMIPHSGRAVQLVK